MGKFKSLSAKISIYIGMLVLLICLVFGVITFKKGSDAVKAEIEKSLLLVAEEGSNYLESHFEHQLSILETIAERTEIKSMNWEEQMPTIVAEESRLSQFLALAIVDMAGNANYSDGSTAKLGDREYVIQAMAGKSVVSDLIVSRVNNSLVLMYAVPVKQNGRVVGALIARRDGTSLSNITDRTNMGQKLQDLIGHFKLEA